MTGDFKILCFDDATGMPMDIPTIVDYKYEVILPTDQMAKMPLMSSLQMWMSF